MNDEKLQELKKIISSSEFNIESLSEKVANDLDSIKPLIKLFRENDVNLKYKISKLLVSASNKKVDFRDKLIVELVEDLPDNDKTNNPLTFRYYIVKTLGSLGFSGIDISKAGEKINELAKDDSNKQLVVQCYRALLAIENDRDKAISQLVNIIDKERNPAKSDACFTFREAALTNIDLREMIKVMAKNLNENKFDHDIFEALGTLAEKNVDMTLIVKKIAKELKDKNLYDRLDASEVLLKIAKTGTDLSSVLTDISDALTLKLTNPEFLQIKVNAARIISVMAQNEKNKDAAIAILTNLLSHDNKDVRRSVVMSFGKAIDDNINLSEILRKIAELFKDEDLNVRNEVIYTMSRALISKNNMDLAKSLILESLNNESKTIRIGALKSVRMGADEGLKDNDLISEIMKMKDDSDLDIKDISNRILKRTENKE